MFPSAKGLYCLVLKINDVTDITGWYGCEQPFVACELKNRGESGFVQTLFLSLLNFIEILCFIIYVWYRIIYSFCDDKIEF